MTKKIRIGIAGYGNLGRGVESAIYQNGDMELVGAFTRRNPEDVNLLNESVPVYALARVEDFKEEIDVLILCGGSKNDLPEQGPMLAKHFTTIDSFDTHADIPKYFDAVDQVAKPNEKTAIISVGWDPGLFSMNRLFGESVLADGTTYTFWGKGLSQGHSDAVRRVPGVKGAVQYTIPNPEAVEQVRSGSLPELTTREQHTRECYVVLEEGADAKEVEQAIVTMPNYFTNHDTTVHFISEEELKRDHAAMPHGGFVIRSGKTGDGNNQVIEYALKLESNPEFTASVLVAYARAAYRLNQNGDYGAKTVFDVAPGLLSPKSAATLRKELL
ncbi:diaminopimelate dehydrogenase [Sporosarcina pasteurii]|uniref:Meso-diaminopimelate D-dehydrogenase n=1 Tax=Sporosarcina pasteurii TaxID=1474 RepID=A0A380C5F2_SPOPA|nr:diaminopimelate dehydrogenase [Sporosarcina pasteurii]MDS9471695.1 diaminopimelate dehydrogenase [Sporosarcina pasteurii]QBQ04704.1 diaminopimelate dehydrogenase [Sporosarcina pasteurii]SUJ12093.1 Meso-diaminopimelate D-dehydrogenase [Sporosarcina pasteurii]